MLFQARFCFNFSSISLHVVSTETRRLAISVLHWLYAKSVWPVLVWPEASEDVDCCVHSLVYWCPFMKRSLWPSPRRLYYLHQHHHIFKTPGGQLTCCKLGFSVYFKVKSVSKYCSARRWHLYFLVNFETWTSSNHLPCIIYSAMDIRFTHWSVPAEYLLRQTNWKWWWKIRFLQNCPACNAPCCKVLQVLSEFY